MSSQECSQRPDLVERRNSIASAPSSTSAAANSFIRAISRSEICSECSDFEHRHAKEVHSSSAPELDHRMTLEIAAENDDFPSVVDQRVHDDPGAAFRSTPVADGKLPDPDIDIPGEVYGVLHRLAGKWTDVLDKQDLILKPVKGAMTNHVYECQWPQQDHKNTRKVLVRVYGEGCDLFFSRDVEIRTFERMSLVGQGPRLLARFPNGRVEEFLNARTLRKNDLRNPTISARIAAKLSEFHKLDMPGPRKPQLWERLRFWLTRALEIYPLIRHEEFHLHFMMDEISELEFKVSSPREREGFCHNDLQYGNIMMNETDGSVTIIDYEYASFNAVAFDIANHFCEMTADYHSETPHILDYSKYPACGRCIYCYTCCTDLCTCCTSLHSGGKIHILHTGNKGLLYFQYSRGYEERLQFVQAYLKTSDSCFMSADTEELLKEVEGYTLASHLHWGLWGILSATFSDIDFDYLGYAQQRFQLYYHYKPLLLQSD